MLTPDEQEVVDIARAKAKARARAAEAEAAATPQESGWPMAKSLIRGAGRGLTSTLEVPEQALTGIENIPARISNAIARSDALSGPHPPVGSGVPDPPVAQIPLKEPNRPWTGTYNQFLPPDPNHPEAEAIGEIAGATLPAIVGMPPAAGSTRLAETLPRIADLAASTTGTYGGAKGGKAIDQALGGSGDTGETLGSIFGSFVSPALVATNYRRTNRKFTDEASAGKLADAQTRNIPLSIGLVGNKQAMTNEDAITAVPWSGRRVADTRRAQYTAFDQGMIDTGAEIRGGAPAGPIASKGDIGLGVINAADEANRNVRGALDATYNPLVDQYGRDNPIEQVQQRQDMEAIRRQADPTKERPGIEHEQQALDASRRDPLNPPKVVDPVAEQQLQFDLARAQANQMNAPSQALAAQWQPVIDDLQRRIDENRGQTLGEAIKSKSRIGSDVPNLPRMDQSLQIDLKGAADNAIGDALERIGIPRARYDAANREYGRLAGQRGTIQDIGAMDTGDAYNALLSSENAQNLGPITALHEHAPSQLADVLANNLELKGRGQSAGAPTPNPETVTTKTGLVPWWTKLPSQVQDITAGPLGTPTRDRLEALVRSMQADSARPTRTIPRGGNTMSAPGNLYPPGIDAAGMMAADALSSGGSGGSIARLLSAVAGKTTRPLKARYDAMRFTDPNWVANTVNPPPYVQAPDIARLLAAATVQRQQELDQGAR